MNPITLAISTGRCGTTFLEKTFKLNFGSDKNWISHEYLKQDITKVGIYHRCYSGGCLEEMGNVRIQELVNTWLEISKSGPVVDFGWTMRVLIPYLYEKIGSQLRVLFIHRHPIEVAASFKLIGSYSVYNSPQWAISPWHDRALYPQFKDRWPSMTPFEKCLYLWLEVNSFGLEVPKRFPNLQFLQIRSDELFRRDTILDDIVRFTGFQHNGLSLKRSNEKNRRDLFSLERRPIKNEWVHYNRHPEVISLAEELGYNMSVEYISDLITKYQLPQGIMPFLRNKSGFWAHKQNVGSILKILGLRG
jgi:hypothetical protein